MMDWEARKQLEDITDFIENAPVPLHWVNNSGIIIWANQAELDMLGYTREEYLNKHISNFHTDKEAIENILIRLINKETITNEMACLKCKDGSVKYVLLSTNVYWKDNEFIHTRCFTRDVTEFYNKENEKRENKKSQEVTNKRNLIKESTLLNKMLLEVKDYAIFLLWKDGTVRSWNQGAERIKGYTEDEIIGQNFNIFYLPEDRQKGLPEKLLAEAATNGRAVHEGLRLRKNGTTFFGNIVITALHDDNGDIIGFTKVTSDLTERRNIQDILRA